MTVVRLWERDLAAGTLPPICVITGRPTTETRRVRFVTTPGWIVAFLFVGVLPFIVAWLLTRRVVTARLPMTLAAQRWRTGFAWKVNLTWIGATVGSIAAAWLISLLAPSAAPVAALLALACVVGCWMLCDRWYRSNAIRGHVSADSPWGRTVTIFNVDPTFAAAALRIHEQRQPPSLPQAS